MASINQSSLKNEIVLVIDPSSHSAAACLIYKGEFLGTVPLQANAKSKYTTRLHELSLQLSKFLTQHLKKEKVTILVVEQVSGFGNAALSYSVGALAALPNIDAALETIAIRTWKAYAKRHGATGTIIKGIKTLKQINPEMAKLCKSDDEADAILMAMAYFDKKGTEF